jgi:hypothetical protein
VPIVTEVPFLEPIDDWLESQVEKDDYAPEYQDDGKAKDVKGGVEGADYFLRLTSGIRRGKNVAKLIDQDGRVGAMRRDTYLIRAHGVRLGVIWSILEFFKLLCGGSICG